MLQLLLLLLQKMQLLLQRLRVPLNGSANARCLRALEHLHRLREQRGRLCAERYNKALAEPLNEH